MLSLYTIGMGSVQIWEALALDGEKLQLEWLLPISNTTTHLLEAGSDPLPPSKAATEIYRHPQWNQMAPNRKVIFYHIYVPDDAATDATRRVADMVKEQLQQIGSKTNANNNNNDGGVTVFYNTVGKNSEAILPSNVMQQWCQEASMECVFQQHLDEGMEDLTLKHVHDFCHTQPQQENRRVGYVHNKGSHHANVLNDEWRYLMTQALMQDECWIQYNTQQPPEQQKEEEQCNVCGLYFTTDRGFYVAGNVWVADCQYINRLHSPQYYESQIQSIVGRAMVQRVLHKFIMARYPPDQPEFLGLGRFATEWWMASHPTVRPCDFSASFVANNGETYDRTRTFLHWVIAERRTRRQAPDGNYQTPLRFVRRAPHHAYLAPPEPTVEGDPKQPPPPQNEEESWKRDFYQLPGLLYRWWNLYQELPASDSFVWDHYPHGDWWKQQVHEHGGSKVVDQFTGMESNRME